MTKAMFEREGHFWVAFVQNKERTGTWIYAENAKTAKFLFARKEGVTVSSYIVSSKKGFQP